MDRLFVQLDDSSREAVNVALKLGELLVDVINEGDKTSVDTLDEDGHGSYSVSIISVEDIGLPESLNSTLNTGEPLVLESDLSLSVYFKLIESDSVLLIRMPPDSNTNASLRWVLTLSFYALVAALLLAWLYPHVRRLRRLASVAKKFGEGDLQQRVETSPQSSMHDIEAEFNRMAQRLQGLVDDNKMLCGAVSHDLRTPLARLRFGIDALSEQFAATSEPDLGASIVDSYLDRINADLYAMEQLVAALLEFARLDQQLSELPLSSVCLSLIVRECSEAQVLNSTRDIRFENLIDDAMILADERYASMLVSNLLHNAVKYSSHRVDIRLSKTTRVELPGPESTGLRQPVRGTNRANSSHYLLVIDDDGPGFDLQDINRLTKPFEKGSNSTATDSAKSYGLGLAIVVRIAQWFNAELEFGVSDDLGGARVSVKFIAVQQSID